MTFAELSTTGKDTGRPLGKALEDKSGVNSSGTHHSDSTDIGRVLVASNTGSIGCGVTTPVT
jgi:hypothetical protein